VSAENETPWPKFVMEYDDDDDFDIQQLENDRIMNTELGRG
jgi:hypothetical protein